MANYTVATGQRARHGITLTANVVDTVTFVDNIGTVQVMTDGAAVVFFTTDGSDPSVGGANCYVLPAGVIAMDERDTINTAAGDVVKLVSAGTPTVSVIRA